MLPSYILLYIYFCLFFTRFRFELLRLESIIRYAGLLHNLIQMFYNKWYIWWRTFCFDIQWKICMCLCMYSGNTFAETLLYSGVLGCWTVLIHGLHPTLTHAYKQFNGHCDLSSKLFLDNQNGFPTRPVKGNASPKTNYTKRLSAIRQLGWSSCISEVNCFTSGQKNFEIQSNS